MAHDSKRGFLASLFSKKKQTEEEEISLLESRHKLEERIRQVLADSVEIPKVLMMEHNHAALPADSAPPTPEEVVETPVELFPISASVIRRKVPVQSDFLLSTFEVPRSYAANGR